MANNNLFQQIVTPEKPKILADERVYVYVPTATNSDAGIASFKNKDFNIKDGRVSLIWPMQMDIEKLSNPLANVSRIKVLSDEFEQTGNTATVINLNTGEEYSSKTAEVKLKRTGRNAFLRPDLVQLDMHDFVAKEDGVGFVKYTIKENNPFVEPSLVQVDTKDFRTENKNIVRISWPLAHDASSNTNTNGYGLVKIANNSEGYLKYSENGFLELDSDKIFTSDKATIKPLYSGTKDSGFNDIDDYLVNGKAARNKSGNVLLAITKDAVGLTNVANRTFASYKYEEFGEEMQESLKSKFDEKVNLKVYNVQYDRLRSDIAKLNGVDNALQAEIDTLKSVKLFLGYFATPEVLKSEYPASEEYFACYARVLSTNTYWTVQHNETDNYVWVDTTYSKIDFIDYVETDSRKLKPNGVASIGSSMNWVSSDHVHPTDTTRLDASLFHGTRVSFSSAHGNSTQSDYFKLRFNKNEDNTYTFVKTVNIPYVQTAKTIHNWKADIVNNTYTDNIDNDEYIWVGSYDEYLEEAPKFGDKRTLFFVDDGDQYTSEHHASITELDKAGVTIDYYDQNEKIITTTESEVSVLLDTPVTLKKVGNRYRLSPIDLVGDGKVIVTHRTDDGNITIESKSYRANNIIGTDNLGNLEAINLHPTSILRAADNGLEDTLPVDELVISDSNNTLKTFNTGVILNRLLVSDGNGSIKTAQFNNTGLFLLSGENGVLEPFYITPDNFLVTDTTIDAEILEAGKILLSSDSNKVTTFTTTTNNRPIVANAEGSIKELNLTANRLVYTDANGGIQAFPVGVNDHGKYLGVDAYGNPAWVVDNTPNELPVDTLYSAPTSDNQNGTKFVILSSAPTNFYNGYLYLY